MAALPGLGEADHPLGEADLGESPGLEAPGRVAVASPEALGVAFGAVPAVAPGAVPEAASAVAPGEVPEAASAEGDCRDPGTQASPGVPGAASVEEPSPEAPLGAAFVGVPGAASGAAYLVGVRRGSDSAAWGLVASWRGPGLVSALRPQANRA